MANWHEWSVLEVVRPEEVGCGIGIDEEGCTRVCVSFGGQSIGEHLAEDTKAEGWISLTPECAKELFFLLRNLRHLWEEK